MLYLGTVLMKMHSLFFYFYLHLSSYFFILYAYWLPPKVPCYFVTQKWNEWFLFCSVFLPRGYPNRMLLDDYSKNMMWKWLKLFFYFLFSSTLTYSSIRVREKCRLFHFYCTIKYLLSINMCSLYIYSYCSINKVYLKINCQ